MMSVTVIASAGVGAYVVANGGCMQVHPRFMFRRILYITAWRQHSGDRCWLCQGICPASYMYTGHLRRQFPPVLHMLLEFHMHAASSHHPSPHSAPPLIPAECIDEPRKSRRPQNPSLPAMHTVSLPWSQDTASPFSAVAAAMRISVEGFQQSPRLQVLLGSL